MDKTGIVISVSSKKAGIMTNRGEFVYIKSRKALPKIGEIHTGELCSKPAFIYKYMVTAASLMFICISSIVAYAYYTPVTTLVLSINPSISIEANRWNKIIGSKALDSDGSLILNKIVLTNKSIDNGLELLVKEAKAENFINDKYINDKKIISVHIRSNKNISIDVSNFKDIIDTNKLNIKINVSSENNKNIDIIVNNEKWDIVNNTTKKPLVDTNTNTNTIEEKPSIIKEGNKDNINKNNNINKDIKTENKDLYLNKKNNPSLNIKKSDNNNNNNNQSEKKSQFYKSKNVQMHNDNTILKKQSYETNKINNKSDHSYNYKSQKTKNNSLNKFLKNFND